MNWSCMVSPTHSDTEIKSAPVIANAVAIVGTHGGTVAGSVFFLGDQNAAVFVSLSLHHNNVYG